MLIAILVAASLAAEDPEGVVATARAPAVNLDATFRPAPTSVSGAAQAAAPHGLTTDEQIQRWLASRAPNEGQSFPEGLPGADGDRKPHAEVNFGIGTGGYRDYGAAVSLPLGDTGRLDLRYRQVENGYPYRGYGYGYDDDALDRGHVYPGRGPDPVATFDSRRAPPGERLRLRDDSLFPDWASE